MLLKQDTDSGSLNERKKNVKNEKQSNQKFGMDETKQHLVSLPNQKSKNNKL